MDCERENGWKALPAQPPRLCIGRRVSPQSSYCGGSYRRLLPDRLVQAGVRAPSSHGLLLLLGARKKKKVAGPTALFHAISGAFRRRTCSPMVAARCLDAPASVGLTGPHARGFHTHLHSASLPARRFEHTRETASACIATSPKARCAHGAKRGRFRERSSYRSRRRKSAQPATRRMGDFREPRMNNGPAFARAGLFAILTPPTVRLGSFVRAGEKKSVCGYHQHTSHHHPAPWSRARSLPANPANTV